MTGVDLAGGRTPGEVERTEIVVAPSANLSRGDVVARRTVLFDRARLVRYAGASGDFNRIHWDPAFAQSVGLPSVIAHGMLTMGAAIGCVEEWAGDPGAIVDYRARFTRPVPVPDAATVPLRVEARVGALLADADSAPTTPSGASAAADAPPAPHVREARRHVRIDLTVTDDSGASVLGRAQAVVALPPLAADSLGE